MSAADFALAKAKETGQPYELVAARTETSDTWALPTGKWSVKRHGTTVRVRRAGGWVATDPALEFAPDGKVRPKASAVSIAFSGGGTGPLLTGVKNGRTLSFSWPAALPKPTLAANVATYANVLPDVDLQVKAEVEGFSQLLVVKTPAAAKHPDLATLRLKIDTVGLNVSRDAATGLLTAVNPAGEIVFTSPTPLMWDSTTTAGTAAPAAAGAQAIGAGAGTTAGTGTAAGTATADADPAPSDVFITPSGAKNAQMPATVANGTLEIKPDQALLTSAETKYPVFIDPSVTWGQRQNWAWAYRTWRSNSYWNTKEDVRVGYESETNGLSRSFFQLDTSNVKGAQVTAATFRIKETWAWSCTKTPVDLYETESISPATTWDRQPRRGEHQSTVKDAKGRPGCEAGNLEFDATRAVRAAAAAHRSSVTLGLYAPNESDVYQWKRFDPKTMTLEIQYNNPPDTPSDPGTSPWVPCAQGGTIGNATVSLFATASDRDAGNLTTEFQVFKAGQSTPVASQSIAVNNGKVAAWAVPDATLPNGGYEWKARTTDGDGAQSAWTQPCKFTIDRDRPAKAPKIASTAFPDGRDGWPQNTGKARQEGDFVLSSNGVGDVTWYGYYTDWDPEVKSATVAAGTSFTAKITPPGPGPHFVYAFSQDAAGNRSDTTAYLFYAGRTPAVDIPHDLDGDGRRDIWSADLFGSLLTYTGKGGNKFSASIGSPESFAGAQVATLGDWDGDGTNDMLALQQPAGLPGKTLSVYSNAGGGAIHNPTSFAVGQPANDHWSDAEQIIAPGDLNGDSVPDILVKQGNKLWAYFATIFGSLDDADPVLVGGTDWDKYTVVAPGDTNKDGVPDLWLRDNATGDVLRSHGMRSQESGRAVDLATWGTLSRSKIGSGVSRAAYPAVGSSGDLDGDGVADLWARQADNTMVGWPGRAGADATSVGSFAARFEIDGVPGARIPAGTTLASGQEFSSGNAKLVMQADGNLVLFTKDKKPVWATGTGGNPGAVARMQSDGNFVVYKADGTTPVWSTKTNTPYSYAVLHPRGVLVLYNASGQSLWTSNSQGRPDYNGDGYTDILTRDAHGDVWVTPGTAGTGTGTLGSRYYIGGGWYSDYWTNAYTADLNNDGHTDMIGRNRNGDLYLYPGTGRTGTETVGTPVLIGVGWNTYPTLSFADINNDGRTDVLGRDAAGDIWVIPGQGGTGTNMLGSRYYIGGGWYSDYWTNAYTADLNNDGHTDMIGRNRNGDLYLYPGTGRTGTETVGTPVLIGVGWNTYPTLSFADINNDGLVDLIGRDAGGALWAYPHTGGSGTQTLGSRVLLAQGWSGLDIIR
ncbi:FG-GAP-like repeat-containing protein [Streptomyces sp. enrichment culture]|uniref:FG-GAP repeat domain-containing protein n=1 Tax=Streptomyces sp. enrichment culture TaxID=1795815 RepID=UPI003F564BD5